MFFLCVLFFYLLFDILAGIVCCVLCLAASCDPRWLPLLQHVKCCLPCSHLSLKPLVHNGWGVHGRLRGAARRGAESASFHTCAPPSLLLSPKPLSSSQAYPFIIVLFYYFQSHSTEQVRPVSDKVFQNFVNLHQTDCSVQV